MTVAIRSWTLQIDSDHVEHWTLQCDSDQNQLNTSKWQWSWGALITAVWLTIRSWTL